MLHFITRNRLMNLVLLEFSYKLTEIIQLQENVNLLKEFCVD